jgi:photosystem II stability/assembly factor-like uncharacterized protein
MRKIKLLFSILIIVLVAENGFTQYYYEFVTGITTELKSSSSCRFANNSVRGYACGVNGTVIKSGLQLYSNWINVSGNGIPSNVTLNNMNAVDTSKVFVCGYLNANTWVWKTTNSGLNWIQIFNQPNGMINAIMMKNSQKGFLVGNPVNGRWSLWKTTNGGNNWDSTGMFLPQSGSELGFNNSLYVGTGSDSNKIWFGTNNSRIYYSSNYGINWTAQSTAPEQNSFFVTFSTYSSFGYTGGSNYLLKTTNKGVNWIQETINGTGSVTGFAQLSWDIMVTRGNSIYRWTGSNWSQSYTAPSGTYNFVDNINSIYNNPCDHYAIRTNGGITFLLELEGVKKLSNNIPENFSLSQNYPNPFNPSTVISFQLVVNSSTKLTVYDVLGNEVSTLINEHLKPGIYEVEFNGDNYASGVYYYQLVAGDFIETRKMILVK